MRKIGRAQVAVYISFVISAPRNRGASVKSAAKGTSLTLGFAALAGTHSQQPHPTFWPPVERLSRSAAVAGAGAGAVAGARAEAVPGAGAGALTTAPPTE